MINELIKKGFILKKQGYYKKALEIFYNVLSMDNNSVELLYEIANLYYLLKNEEIAISYIEQVLKRNPLHIESMILLKNIFLNKNDYSHAEEILQNIYALTQSDMILVNLLQVLNIQKKYEQVIQIQSNHTTSNTALLLEFAKAHYQNGSSQNALQILENIDCDEQCFILLGTIYLQQENYEKCEVIIKNLNMKSSNPEIYNFVGLYKLKTKSYKEAEKNFLQAIKLNHNNDEYYFNLATTYNKEKDYFMAKKYYKLAISLKPKNIKYIISYANLYYQEKNYKKALELLTTEDFEINILKIKILSDMNYVALAKKILDEEIKKYPKDIQLVELNNQINKSLQI